MIMLKMRNLFFGAFVALLLTSCASKEVKVSVANIYPEWNVKTR